MRPKRRILVALTCVGWTVVLLVEAYLFFTLGGQDLVRRPTAPPPSGTVAMAAPAGERPDSFADIADAVKPAVVNIATLQATRRGPGVSTRSDCRGRFVMDPERYVSPASARGKH